MKPASTPAPTPQRHLAQLQAQLAQQPQDTDTLNQLMLVLHQLGRDQEALAACRASLSLKPQQLDMLLNAARLAKRLDDMQLALEYTRQALALAPSNQDVSFTHTSYLMEAEQWDQFEHQLHHCQQHWPDEHLTHHFEFCLLIHQNNFEQAYALAQAHPSLRSKDQLNNYGVTVMVVEGAKEAIKIFRQGLRHYMQRLPKQTAQPQAGASAARASKEQAYMDVQQARRALIALKSSLDELGVPFFLAFGTLLGIVRDGELLPHDKDMDVGLPWDTPRLALIEALCTMGFVCPHIKEYRKSMPMDYATVVHVPTRITIDFFFAQPQQLADGTQVVDMGFTKKAGQRVVWRFRPFALSTLEYAGQRFNAPVDASGHLAEIYGSQWHIPDANFDSCLRAFNLVDDGGGAGIALAYNRLLGSVQQGNWRKALGYCQQLQMVRPSPLIAKLAQRLKNVQPVS